MLPGVSPALAPDYVRCAPPLRGVWSGSRVKGFGVLGLRHQAGSLDLEYLGFGLHNTGLDWGLGFKVQYLGFGLHNKSVGV